MTKRRERRGLERGRGTAPVHWPIHRHDKYPRRFVLVYEHEPKLGLAIESAFESVGECPEISLREQLLGPGSDSEP